VLILSNKLLAVPISPTKAAYKPDIIQPKVAIVPQNIDPDWTVYDILNEDAAIEYGKGTNWLTASNDLLDNEYKYYANKGIKLYIGVNKRLNRKVQWDYRDGDIVDESGDPLVYTNEMASIFKIIVTLSPKQSDIAFRVIHDDDTMGLMNKCGDYIIKPHMYSDVQDEREYISVRLSGKGAALIDKKTGAYIIKPGLYRSFSNNGYYWKVFLLGDDSCALIDKKTREYIIQPHLYDNIDIKDKYWEVKLVYDNSYALIDKKTGEYIIQPHLYSSIEDKGRYWCVDLLSEKSAAIIDKKTGAYIIKPGLYIYISDRGKYWECTLPDHKGFTRIDKKSGEVIKESQGYMYHNLQLRSRYNILNEDKISFDNWVIPSDQKLEIEFKYEYQGHDRDRETDYAWKTLQEFIQAVNNSKAEMITPGIDDRVGYRSGCETKEDLIGLISGYRSWPEFRNEKTLQAIYDGFYENMPMDMPIILKFPSGRMSILSGNTRADVAMQLVGKYKAIILEVPETVEERNQVSKVMITESQLKLYLKYLLETNKTLKKESDDRIVYDEVTDKSSLNPNWKQKQDGNKIYFYELLPNGRKIVKCIRSVSNSKSLYYKIINKDEIIEYRLADHWSWYVISYEIADYPVSGKPTYVDVAWGTMKAMPNGVEYVIKLSPDRSKELNKQDVIDAYEKYKGDLFINLHRKTLNLLDEEKIWGKRIYKNLSGNMELPL
jgi:hypothetical protein